VNYGDTLKGKKNGGKYGTLSKENPVNDEISKQKTENKSV
jgi:hypothetical protein